MEEQRESGEGLNKGTSTVVELQEDRSLFERMMMVCKSRLEIDIKVPRSLFTAYGSMFHCSSKISLMTILEKLKTERHRQVNRRNIIATNNPNESPVQKKVIILDWIKNCSQLADHFNSCIDEKNLQSDEVRLILDRYDLPLTLKAATREIRQGGQDPVYCKITGSTKIAKVSMKMLLSHTRTKMELTNYLLEKTMQHAEDEGRRFVVAWGRMCAATQIDVAHLQSIQEEADTKMMLHALYATADGATEIQIHSPDTDPDLCENTSFVTGKGQNHRVINLAPIVQALG